MPADQIIFVLSLIDFVIFVKWLGTVLDFPALILVLNQIKSNLVL